MNSFLFIYLIYLFLTTKVYDLQNVAEKQVYATLGENKCETKFIVVTFISVNNPAKSLV